MEPSNEVDLSTPPGSPPLLPTSSLSSLGTSIDSSSNDISGFINSLLAIHLSPTAVDLPGLDKSLNDLSTRLSLLSQDTSSALEQTIHDISRTVPRLTYDLQFMRESAGDLQASLSLVQHRVAKQTHLDNSDPSGQTSSALHLTRTKSTGASDESDEVKTHRALEKITHLDLLKTRMESARDILREAESWSTLESEITSLISSAAFSKAGSRLAEASRSMVVFQNTPAEYETKRSLLVSLQNELEGALSNGLKDAIEKGDVKEISGFWDVFELMEREDEFGKYYFSQRRGPIVNEWNEAILLDTSHQALPVGLDGDGEGEQPVKMAVFMGRWFSTILRTLEREKDQVPRIFPAHQAPTILSTFLQTTLDGLSPSLETRLSALAEYYGAEALPELIKLYKLTEELSQGVQGILDTLAFNTQGGLLSGNPSSASPTAVSPATPDTPAKHARTPSKKMSTAMSRRFSRPASSFLGESSTGPSQEWETSLFEPFLDLQTGYPALERRYLSHQLKHHPDLSLAVPGHGRGNDASRLLSERSTGAFTLAEEAIERCQALTKGFGAAGLVDSLNTFLTAFFEAQEGLLDSVVSREGKSALSGGAEQQDELDFEGLDYSTEDWGAFQLGLHVLKACRDVRDRLAAFEGKVFVALEGWVAAVRLDPSREKKTGPTVLLQQSTLNSSALQQVLGSLTANTATYPLVPAREALSGLTKQTQLHLQSTILAPLMSQLQSYPSLPVWSQADKAPRRGELQIPSFSLSPTDTIARVSEGLLNLLRVFEVYATDDALSFSLDTLPYVDLAALAAASASPTSAKSHLLPSPTASSPTSTLARHIPTLGAETVLSLWISSLASTLLESLTIAILPSIGRLTNHGANQLESDLGYLSNAVRALDVESPSLEGWKEGVGLSEADWKERRDAIGGGGDGTEGREGKELLSKIGRMRGWTP